MRVSRLEVFGFKSFMERLNLSLDGGLTGVVGPNGCGKSNIVDAIRWVLGETKASALRGGTLEDVIFNGTEALRPLGLAEVTLTIRATSDNIFDEVRRGIKLTITPSQIPVVSTSEIEPSSDGPKLRVIEGGLSEQGEEDFAEESQISDLIPEEDFSDESLSRYEWLKTVPEVQLTRRLYRSGESEFFINRVPCRLRDIKDLSRILGIGARAYTIIAQGEVSRIVSAKPEDRRHILEEAAGVTGLRDKIAEASRRLEDTADNITRLEDIEKEVERQVASLKRQAEKARNRLELKTRLQNLDIALFKYEQEGLAQRKDAIARNLDKAVMHLESAEQALVASQTRESALRGELLRIDVEGDGIRGQIDSIKEELLGRERRRTQQQIRLREVGVGRIEREKELEHLRDQLSLQQKRKEEIEVEISEINKSESQLSSELSALQELGKEELVQAENLLKEARELLKVKEAQLREEREKLVKIEASIDSAEGHLSAASPQSQLKKALADDEIKSLIPSTAKMLVQCFDSDPQFIPALEAVLGERSSFLVTENPHSIGEKISAALNNLSSDRRKGVGVGILNLSSQNQIASEPLNVPSDWVSLFDSLRVQSEASGILQSLLSDVYVATSVEAAQNYFLDNPLSNLIAVTVAGEILTKDLFTRFDRSSGLLELKAKVESLKLNLLQAQESVKRINEERESAQAVVAEREKAHREALSIVEARHEKIRSLSNELGSVRGRLQAEKRILEQLTSDIVKLEQQKILVSHRLDEYEGELIKLQDEASKLTEDDEEPLKAKVSALASELKTFEEQRSSVRNELEQLAQSASESRRRVDEIRAEKSGYELEMSKLNLEFDSHKESMIREYTEEVFSLVATEAVSITEENEKSYRLEAHQLRNRIHREGEVDPESIARFDEESERLSEIKQQLLDLRSASETLSATIIRLTETAEKRFVRMFHAVRKNFGQLIPRLFGGGKGTLELSNLEKPLEGGVEIFVRPPGKKPKSIDLLSGGEKALTATSLIFAIFLERPSPLCVLDEVDAPLDEANLHRFLEMIKELSVKTQFLMITHNKHSMTEADVLVGVTMQEPGASKVISVSLREALAQVA